MKQTYKVGEIKKLIAEGSNEFKAKLGNNVERDNKSNNGKAYSDAKKRAKDFDGGLSDEVGKKKAKYEKTDFNRTTLSHTPENATPEYKKRVHAQAKGYTSELEMNNKIEKVGDFSDNETIYNEFKKSDEEYRENEKALKKSGLQAREWSDKVFDKEDMYEQKSVKTVYFKKTEFINESHMLNKIPDDFKCEGTTFRMKDKTGSEYLIEWTDNRANIIEHTNKQGLDESVARMKALFNYKSSDYVENSNVNSRLHEGNEGFTKTLDNVRKLTLN